MEQTELRTHRTPACLVFADHMNRLVTGNCAPSSPERPEMLTSADPALDGPVPVPGRYRRWGRGPPERCLKISTAILSACLSNDDISNSIRAIAAINPPSTTGGSLLGLAGNSSGAAGDTAGSPAAPAPAAVILRYRLDHLRNDQMLTPSSLARSFVDTPPPTDTRNIPEHGILESAY